jgi:hypothetical protein
MEITGTCEAARGFGFGRTAVEGGTEMGLFDKIVGTVGGAIGNAVSGGLAGGQSDGKSDKKRKKSETFSILR